jgi:hypothetical protein
VIRLPKVFQNFCFNLFPSASLLLLPLVRSAAISITLAAFLLFVPIFVPIEPGLAAPAIALRSILQTVKLTGLLFLWHYFLSLVVALII